MRPFTPRVLLALKLYTQHRKGRYRYRVVEIAALTGLTHSAICRAAKKHGLSRYKECPAADLEREGDSHKG